MEVDEEELGTLPGGFTASPVSSSALLPLKPWTRAASGPDSPVVIRWLLNNPQRKYRKWGNENVKAGVHQGHRCTLGSAHT
ncbi:hypothetical protein INR49_010798 [Caranx melampygus]|nr:hypothetical protein INR49_010798 [Caranx melampygus]